MIKRRALIRYAVIPGLFAAWASSSCGGEPGADEPPFAEGSPASARDSAGIRIVENVDVREVESNWGVVSTPLVQVGWNEGDPDFQSLRSGVLTRTGQIVVVDGGASLMHFLAPDGAVLGTAGGEGDGPGEFRRTGNILELGGDTLLVVDSGNLRLNLFVGQQNVRDIRFENAMPDARYEPVVRSDDGTFLLAPVAFAARAAEAEGWRPFPVLRTTDFVTMDTIAYFPVLHGNGPGNRNPIRQYGVIMGTGGAIAVAKTDEPQIVWVDPDGTLRQMARWDLYPRALTADDWPVFEAEMRERLTEDAPSDRLEEIIQAWRADFGGTTPLFSVARGDREGNVWLGQPEFLSTSTTVYRVVSAAGEWLGTVTFPRPIRLLDITDDRVLGVEVDAFDVEAVVVYELRKNVE